MLHHLLNGVLICVLLVSGEYQIGLNVTPLDPTKVRSEVLYGKASGKYTKKKTGVSMVYNQLYPFEGLWNYTSGIIHHVRVDGKFFSKVLSTVIYCARLRSFVPPIWFIQNNVIIRH